MTLDELIPLSKYNKENDFNFRESLAKALTGKIEIYYVFDGRSYVIYEPEDANHKGKGTEGNLFGSSDAIEAVYAPCDFILLPQEVIRELWGMVSYKEFKVTLLDIIREKQPEGFKLHNMLDGWAREITIDTLYVRKDLGVKVAGSNGTVGGIEKTNNTALKVIGLLMHQLAKSPKYASGTSPNKSQIKELLLDLAEELGINPYGLSKVDERVLADALKYLETQKV
jgi:hypothetical protein